MDLTDKKIRGKSSKYRLRDRRASTRYALMAVVIVVLGYLANYFLRAEKFNIKKKGPTHVVDNVVQSEFEIIKHCIAFC